MKGQRRNRATLTGQLKNVFFHYSTVFQKFGKTQEKININIIKNT